jgi:hypothetical protein
MEENQRQTTINRELYELDQDYKNDTNLNKYIEEAQNFYNGNQYPNQNFNNMIRVSLNICSFSATIKASKLCSTPIYLTYTADNNKTDCTALRRFDEYNCNKLHLKENNYQAALNGFVNGTEVTFIRWDDDDTTYKGIYKGGLSEEHLELRNFAVANPYIQDIQNQAWVMYWDEVPYKAVEDLLEGTDKEKKEKKELLMKECGAVFGDEKKNKEHVNHALVRLFTRFFRFNGEVFFMCQTSSVDVFKCPHPLSRKLSRNAAIKAMEEYRKIVSDNINDDMENRLDKVIDYNIDYEDVFLNTISNKEFTDDEYAKFKEKFSLYPFARFAPFNQNGSFYGRSDIKSLIPIQKGLNFSISMMLKCAENNAYNKIFAKPEALAGQTITNEPSQVITDYSGFTNGWGIKMAESQPMPNGLLDFADRLLAMTRVVYGFNDVMDGSISNQDMSGYMLQQMIKQANTPLEQQQQLFWLYNIEKAAIRLMYYKHYVDEAKYTYELDDSEYELQEQSRMMIKTALENGKPLKTMPNAKVEDFANPTHKTQVRDIKNDDLFGTNFDIAIDAMQGLNDSKLVEQQFWDNLFMQGNIQNISPDMLALYLQASPNVSERTKVALKNVLEKLEKTENTQLKNQLQQLAQYLEQVMAYAKQLEAQTGFQSNYLKNLTAEFSNKINGANKIIQAQQKDLMNMKEPKSKGEVKSNNARGIGGTTTLPQENIQ